MRVILLSALLISAMLFAACDPGSGVDVSNRSDSDVYVFFSGNYGSGAKRPDTSDLSEANLVRPGEGGSIAVLCYSSSINWFVLVAQGREIYARSATCGQWKRSGAWVAIEGTDGQFVVTDSLPD